MIAQIQFQQPALLEQFTLARVLAAALVLALAWILIRWVAQMLETLSRRGTRARFSIKWAEPAFRIGVWFAATLICFDLLAPTRETFLAGIASVGIALGLSANRYAARPLVRHGGLATAAVGGILLLGLA